MKKKEEKINASSRRILLLDRDTLFLPVAKEILQLFGDFEIDLAYSLPKARKALKTKQYDVIVSGYFFDSGETGLDLFMELKAKGNKLPFVMFSIHDEIAGEALKIGVTKFINKNKDCESVYTSLSNTIKEISKR
jgi:DNA-binding NtrC family response regulator